MQKKKLFFESPSSFLLMIAIYVLVMMLLFLCFIDGTTMSLLHSLHLGALLALPVWLAAPWVCRGLYLDEDGMELRYGRWVAARYLWSELCYEAHRLENRYGFRFAIWVKGKEKSKLPLCRYSDAGEEISVILCYALRECFGREPDKGAVDLDPEEQGAIENFPIMNEDQVRDSLRMTHLGLRLITVGVLFVGLLLFDIGVSYWGIAADIVLAVIALICVLIGCFGFLLPAEEERCASFAHAIHQWNIERITDSDQP